MQRLPRFEFAFFLQYTHAKMYYVFKLCPLLLQERGLFGGVYIRQNFLNVSLIHVRIPY